MVALHATLLLMMFAFTKSAKRNKKPFLNLGSALCTR